MKVWSAIEEVGFYEGAIEEVGFYEGAIEEVGFYEGAYNFGFSKNRT